MKKTDRNLYAAFIIILIIMFLSYFNNTTGFAPVNTIFVSIREKFEGKITSLSYSPMITMDEYQNITMEFTDTGSLPMNIRLELYVYKYDNGTMNLSGQYFDSSAYLNPGMMRTFRALYTPPDIGTFYIKARSVYEGRVAETWGIFSVIYYYNYTNQTTGNETGGGGIGTSNQTNASGGGTGTGTGGGGGGGGGGAAGGGEGTGTGTGKGKGKGTGTGAGISGIPPTTVFPIPRTTGVAKLDVLYPEIIDIYPNQTIIVNITVVNTGERDVHNIRLYVSTIKELDLNINPKVVSSMIFNESKLFLISLTNMNATPGRYSLEFDVITTEITVSRSSTLVVHEQEIPIAEDLYAKIINYKFLILQIEQEIFSAYLKGFDVKLANSSINYAKAELESAREFYYQGNYPECRHKLDITKSYIEDAVFQLAHATIVTYARPIDLFYLIVLLPVFAVIIIFFLLKKMKRKKKEKLPGRPKFLSAAEEEGQ